MSSSPFRLAALVRARPQVGVDVGLAVLVCALSAFPQLWGVRADWTVLGLDVLTGVPLVWRRRFPIPVAVMTGAGTVALSLLNTMPKLPYGQLVATYTFAALSGPVVRLLAAAATAGGVAASLVFDPDPVVAGSVSGMMFVVAYALGVSARARRDRIAMLEERGARLAEGQAGAAAAERERIARDMHDILVHSVSLIVVQAEAGAAVVDSAPHRAQAAFEAISSTGRDALTQLRRTLGVLRGGEAGRHPQPDLKGLATLAARARSAGLEVVEDELGPGRAVPAELAVAAYRIVQEALTNTLRHAGARRVELRLRWLPQALRIEVIDDGRGCVGASPGHGLVGMRERATAYGGELRTGPGPGGTGFQVIATLPVPR